MIHRSTSGNPLPQHCETHQEQTGKLQAGEAATGHAGRRTHTCTHIDSHVLCLFRCSYSFFCLLKLPADVEAPRLPSSGQTEASYHVVWGGDELHSGVLDLWSLMGLPVRPGDRVVHKLVRNWTRRRAGLNGKWSGLDNVLTQIHREPVSYHHWPGSRGCTSTCAGPGKWQRGWCMCDRSGSALSCSMWSPVAAAEKRGREKKGRAEKNEQ